jgi:C4-dicarboxylate-specific signal transduction histidine kinase
MKTRPVNPENSNVQLHPLIDQLMKAYLPQAVKQSSFIINDVKPGLCLMINEQTLAHVLGNLIGQVVQVTTNGCIRVYAEDQGKFVQIGLKEVMMSNHEPFFLQNLSGLYEALKKLGGNISIDDKIPNGAIISITIPCDKKAA